MVMKKTFAKTVFRTIKSNFARFIAITAVVFLGVAFVAGLGALSPIYKETISDEFIRRGGADIVVKSKAETGLSDDDPLTKHTKKRIINTIRLAGGEIYAAKA